MSYDSTKNKITVVVTDFNYDELQNGIVESIEHALESGFEPGTCGVDIRGESACEKVAGTFCLNTKDNGFDSPFCAAQHIRELSLRRSNYHFLPSLLGFYWQNGIEIKAVEFLRNSSHVTNYKSIIQFLLPKAFLN